MHEDELKTTEAAEMTEDALLPDGWSEGQDIFNPESWGTVGRDAQETETAEGTSEDASAITIGQEGTEDGQSAEASTVDTQPGQAAEETETAPKKYRVSGVVVNHGAPEDVELTEDELRAVVQKARAFDQRQEQQRKATYRETYQRQLDSGMTEDVARLVAEKAADGHTYALTDEEEAQQAAAQAAAVEAPKETTPVQDLAKVIDTFYRLYPGERDKPIPDEVALAVAGGAPFMQTMLAHMKRQTEAANKALKAENAVLKQNAAAAAHAPVKGVTGGGDTKQKRESDFLRGFNDAGW